MGRDWSKLDQVADAVKYNQRSDRQMWVCGITFIAVIAVIVLFMR